MRRLRYIKSYADRHGKVRHYLRKPGCRPVPLPEDYGSKPFMDAYWQAMEEAPKRVIGAEKIAPGSVAALIALYYQSKAFKKNGARTRATYRNVLEKIRQTHGDKLVKGLRQRHVVAILDGLERNSETWRKMLRLILNLALERGWIDMHPMTGMRVSRKPLKGFRAWTREEMAAFEKTWPSGSRERLAYALLLYTGQRRSDVVSMGRQHVRGDQIHVVQQKTKTRLAIAIHANLRAELNKAPRDQMTFIQTAYGEPFSAAGFTAWFGKRAEAAGLPPDCTPHGLRKAAAVMLAEAGCTPSQIMAVTGHQNLSEVTLYTAAADQQRLAREAIAKAEAGTKTSNPRRQVRQSGRKE